MLLMMVSCRRAGHIASVVLFLGVLVPALFAAGPPTDSDNPVDLYGPDGLAFTCDDILIPRGGYTNTAIFATAYGEQVDGDVDNGESIGSYEQRFNVVLGSWNPAKWDESQNPNGENAGSTVMVHYVLKNDDPEIEGTGTTWRYAPAIGGPSWSEANMYEMTQFGQISPSTGDPRVPDLVTASADDGGGGDFRDTTWWNGGQKLIVSGISMGMYQKGTLDGDFIIDPATDDPAIAISPKHFPPVRNFIKDIGAATVRFRVFGLSTLNLENGASGVTMFGSIFIDELNVSLDGNEDMDGYDVHIEGNVANDSPELEASVEVCGIDFNVDVELTGEDDVDIDIEWSGPIPTGVEVKVGASYIINQIRSQIDPPMDPLSTAAKDRIKAQFTGSPKNGIDCLAMEVVRALTYGGAWLEWIGTDDAAMLVNEKPAPSGDQAVDLSGTALDTTGADFRKSSDYLTASESLRTTNWGLDRTASEALLYGRDSAHHYSRLVEWYASNWLCMNLTDFQPYRIPGQTYDQGQAEWVYYDLICDKNLTDGDGPDGGLKMDNGWPPSSHWYGGQGIILTAQGAVAHQGNASGGAVPEPTDSTMPGDPSFVFAGIVALTPFAIEESSGNYLAVYNVRGTTLGGTGWDINYKKDCGPSAGNWYVPWPPKNDDPTAALKFFHGDVANGHDDNHSSGLFHSMWDFNGDGATDLEYANASYDPNGSNFGHFFVVDLNTKRTGTHLVDIFYEKGDWTQP